MKQKSLLCGGTYTAAPRLSELCSALPSGGRWKTAGHFRVLWPWSKSRSGLIGVLGWRRCEIPKVSVCLSLSLSSLLHQQWNIHIANRCHKVTLVTQDSTLRSHQLPRCRSSLKGKTVCGQDRLLGQRPCKESRAQESIHQFQRSGTEDGAEKRQESWR